MPFRLGSVHILCISLFLHLILLLYGNHIDSHPERFGGLKYTDVDWLVVSDGAKLIFSHEKSVLRAKGWLTKLSGFNIGE